MKAPFLTPALAILVAASQSFGAILTLNPQTDTYVRGGTSSPGTQNTNFGAATELLLGSVAGGDSARPIFTFDLSNPLLAGATINSVSLTFVTTRDDSGSTTSPVSYSVHELTQSYVANQATWAISETGTPWSDYSGAPLFTGGGGVFDPIALTSISVIPNGIGIGTTVSFTNTAAFSSLIESNFGGSVDLLLKQNAESATRNLLGFHSLESTTAGFRPVLTIDFTPIPEPSTWALLLGGLGMALAAGWRARRANRI